MIRNGIVVKRKHISNVWSLPGARCLHDWFARQFSESRILSIDKNVSADPREMKCRSEWRRRLNVPIVMDWTVYLHQLMDGIHSTRTQTQCRYNVFHINQYSNGFECGVHHIGHYHLRPLILFTSAKNAYQISSHLWQHKHLAAIHQQMLFDFFNFHRIKPDKTGGSCCLSELVSLHIHSIYSIRFIYATSCSLMMLMLVPNICNSGWFLYFWTRHNTMMLRAYSSIGFDSLTTKNDCHRLVNACQYICYASMHQCIVSTCNIFSTETNSIRILFLSFYLRRLSSVSYRHFSSVDAKSKASSTNGNWSDFRR